ncbi:MAG: peptidoglycan DD-metalloendopeptidase family protein [Betaproteobacteria bacterium]
MSQPPASRQAKDGMYTVQRGDTLYGIALAFGQDAREIARWNGIEDPSRLTVGQSLRVAPPTAAAVTAVPVAPVAAAQTQPLASGTAQLPGGGAALPPIAPAASSAPATAAGSGVPSAAAATPPVATASATAPALPSPGATTAPPVAAAAAPSAASTKPGEAALGGNWAWPIEGKVIETFNETRNKGIDIAGKEGDPVMAAADGQVVYIGSGLRGYGNLVIVKHDDDYVTAYAHNRQILVKQGQSVSRGQRIAELGKTDAELPKLHFEIRRQGKPIDPLTVLPKR